MCLHAVQPIKMDALLVFFLQATSKTVMKRTRFTLTPIVLMNTWLTVALGRWLCAAACYQPFGAMSNV